METTLLSWTRLLADASEASGVTILKTSPPSLAEYPPAEANGSAGNHGAEKIRLEKIVAASLGHHPAKVLFHRDPPIRPTLEELSSGDYDMVVTSSADHESRGYAERLARKSPVGVLVIPTKTFAPPRRILTGVDFDRLSALAIDWAEAFATLHPNNRASLSALHIASVPDTARATMAISHDALRRHVVTSARESLQTILKNSSRDPQNWETHIDCNHLPGKRIASFAHPNGYDLLVIGCQGRSALSVALLGSHAAEVIRNAQLPVLIVKEKNESLAVLKSLLGQEKAHS